MLRYVIRRVLWAIVLMLAVTLITYVMFFAIPIDAARLVAGKSASPAEVKVVAHRLYLDRPIYAQYGHFLYNLVVNHSLGYSYNDRQSVNSTIFAAAPVTASLVFGGAILWMLIAVPVGVLSALKPRSVLDRTAMVGVLTGISAHPVWLGYMASYLIGYKLGWLPIQNYCNFSGTTAGQFCGGPWDWFTHMILPWSVFAILYAAFYVRMIRGNVMETMNEDYVRTARAKGAPESLVLRRHVLRNAMLPVVTMLGMDIAIALGGALLVEVVFGLPGLGAVAVQSVEQYDLPKVMGVVVFAAAIVVTFNLIVDILYAWIDPRIRLA
jgi:peptide/nickel transport system permease protein